MQPLRNGFLIIVALMFFACIFFAGCNACNKPGSIRVTTWQDTGQKPSVAAISSDKNCKNGNVLIEVTQPPNPSEGASVYVNGIQAQVGASRGPDHTLALLQPLTWAGIALCVIGVVILVGRRWIPLIPISAGLAAMALGAGFIVLPMVLDRYLGWIVFGGGVILLIILGIFAYRLRWFDLQISPETQRQRQDKGDHRAAGALAWLQQNAPFSAKSEATSASEVIFKAKQVKPADPKKNQQNNSSG
jgi:hypothetical protein